MSPGDWLVDGNISEAAWGRRVEGLLNFYGWRWFHAPDNKPRAGGRGRAGKQRVTPGFPDYVAVRDLDGPELAVLELKAENGRHGPGQEEWLAAFAGLSVYVARAVAAAEDSPRPLDRPPRVHVGTFRPSQERELERLLAGPAGVDVLVGELDRL